jgi:hypothetical protein
MFRGLHVEKKKVLQSHFPRSSELPTQSPKYWTKEKDRYLRQLLINDIEEITKREFLVYFSQLDQPISAADPDDLSEIISGAKSKHIDLMLQTPGGEVDATEKLVSVLRKSFTSFRVIVPSWAKSAGTVIAISSNEIVMGVNSELGPIDPQFPVNGNLFPAEILAGDPEFPQHLRDFFSNAVSRTKAMAGEFLRTGMLKGAEPEKIKAILDKISTTNGYLSHGAVIDFDEAKGLGLSVTYLSQDDDLWRRIWLLYCMYDYDMKQKGYGKLFESVKYSIARPRSA